MPILYSNAHDPPITGDTYNRLIGSGLALFGQHDFDSVTTRQLAVHAGVNQAAIPYHFGTKKALYHAVARYVGEQCAQALQCDIDGLRALVDDPKTDPNGLLEGIASFVTSFMRMLLDSGDSEIRAGFILREQLHPTVAFDILYEAFIGDVHHVLTMLVARLFEMSPGSAEAVMHAHALIGQLLGFRIARPVLIRRLVVDELDPGQIERFLVESVIQSLRAQI